ncbi:hypothetical protein V8D89_006888 [Ganoderma adspersum]
MKFSSVVVALIAAAVAVAGPVSSKAHEDSPTSVELNGIDHAAIGYLVPRGLFDEASLEARGLLDIFKGKSSPKQPLTITFRDPSDPRSPISDARKKQATKLLKKAVGKNDMLARFPFCDLTFTKGRAVSYICFATAAKKIGERGPGGAFLFE